MKNKLWLVRPIAVAVSGCFGVATSYANPTGPQVVSGTATFARPNAQTLNVTNSAGAIINWQGFSIAAGETTRFNQPSASSAVLNRVVGADISQIYGQLASNGRVYLINPAGIVIGNTGVIDTAGFVGSSLQMTNADFLAGKLKFEGDAGSGAVVNRGRITARDGGNVIIAAPTIENHGAIQTQGGEIVLAAGRKMEIGSTRLEGVRFEIQAPTDSVVNVGRLIAEDGVVGLFAGTLRHSGDVRATALARDEAGRIVLKGRGDVTVAAGSNTSADGKTGGNVTIQSETGTTLVAGDVSAKGSEGKGGEVQILGVRAGVVEQAVVDVSGERGGGQILVGGSFQGKDASVQNASQTLIASGAKLRADAVTAGDGGRVIVWADDFTRFNGTISAQGGSQGGNGGFVETSGKEYLSVGETARVHTGAPNGRGGEWLLDPKNIRVVADASDLTPVSDVDEFSDNPGADATINNGTLNAYAGIGSNNALTLEATNDIVFDAPVTLDAGVWFTARAGRSIEINQDITLQVGAGGPDLNFTANHPSVTTNRDAGPAQLVMAPGTRLTVPGNIFLEMGTGAASGGASGAITLADIRAQGLSVVHNGPTAGGSILRAAGTPTIEVNPGSSVYFDIGAAAGGAGSSIGTSAAPMRITVDGVGNTVVLEASYLGGGDGIFVDALNNLQVGGSLLRAGTVTGVQTRTTGAGPAGEIQLTTTGTFTQLQTDNCASAIGGPICAGGGVASAADLITLRAVDMTFSGDSTASRTVQGDSVVLLPNIGGEIAPGSAGGPLGVLRLTNAEIGLITTNALRIGEATAAGDASSSGNITFAAGITAPAGASIEFRSGGSITSSGVTDITTTAGATPGDITLVGASIGTSVANRFRITPAANADVSVTSTAGDIFLLDGRADIRMSKYDLALPAGQTVNLQNTGGTTTLRVDGDINVPSANVVLTPTGTSGTVVFENAPTVTANLLTIGGNTTSQFNVTGTATLNSDVTATQAVQFNSGTVDLNGAVTFNQPVTIQGGTVNVNAASTIAAGVPMRLTLSSGELGGTGELTINGNMLWTGGDMSGSGSIVLPSLGDTLFIQGNTARSFTQRTITGHLEWTDAATISSDGGVITIAGNGTFSVGGNGSWIKAGAGAAPTRLNNTTSSAGLTRTGSTGVAALDNMFLSNSDAGGVTVFTGVLRLGGELTAATTSTFGPVTVNNGTTLEFAGGTNVVANGLAGGGILAVTGNAVLDVSGSITHTGTLRAFGGTTTVAAGTAYGPNSLFVSDPTGTTPPTVTFERSVNIGNGGLTVTAGTLNFNADSTLGFGPSALGGGTLGGSGTLRVEAGQTLNWMGGNLSGTGKLSIESVGNNAFLAISGPDNREIQGGYGIDNSGIVTWTGTGNISAAGNTTITNRVGDGGGWNAQNDSILGTTGAGTLLFDNQAGAVLTKSGVGTTTTIAGTLNNAGSVTVNSGTLRLTGGGTTTAAGTFTVNTGANVGTLEFGGGTHTVGGAINGGGNLVVSAGNLNANGAVGHSGAFTASGGTATFAGGGTYSPDTVTVSGGDVTFGRAVAVGNGGLHVSAGTANFNVDSTLDGNNTLSGTGTLGGSGTLTVPGSRSFTWSGGDLSGSGRLALEGGGGNDAILAITGNDPRQIDGGYGIESSGIATWNDAGNILASGATVITNTSDGRWTSNNNSTLGTTGAGTLLFDNQGAFTKATAGTTTTIAGTFNNAGTVTVNNGTLSLTGGGTGSNTFTVTDPGTLSFGGGTYGLTGTSSVTGTGTVAVNGATAIVNVAGNYAPTGLTSISNGTINFNVDDPSSTTGTLDLSGGTLGGTGSLLVTGTATWSAGNMSGSGTTTINDTLTISGTSAKSFTGRTLETVGIVWTGDGTITSHGGEVTLNGDGLDIQGNGTWAAIVPGTSAPTRFNNHVIIQRTAGTGTAALDNVFLTTTGGPAAGAVVVGTGTLRLHGEVPQSQSSNPGPVTVSAAGAVLEFAGANSLVGGDVTGPGTVRVSDGRVDFPGTYTAALEVTGGLAQFPVSGPNVAPSRVDVSGGTALFSVDAMIGGGSLSGTGDLQVSNPGTTLSLTGGTFDWTGGTLTGNGTFLVDTPAAFNISTNATHTLRGGITLENSGTVTWTGAGNVSATSGSNLISNLGQWNAQNNSSLVTTGAGTTLLFENQPGATLTRSGAGTSSFGSAASSFTFNNSGDVVVTGGALNLRGTGGGSHGGDFNLTAGRLRILDATHTLQAGSSVTGAGTLEVAALGTLDVNIATTVPNLELNGGTLAGAENLTVSGNFNAIGGTITGNGRLRTDGTTSVTGAITLTDKVWDNAGALTMSGVSSLTLGGTGVEVTMLSNLGTGSVTTTSTSPTLIGSVTTPTNKRFDNQGVFNKNAGSAATQSIDVAMTNSGTVNVNSDTLVLSSFPTNDGTLNFTNNAVLSTNGNALTNAATGIITGTGTIDLGGQALTTEGTLRPGTSPGTLNITGDLVLAATSITEIEVQAPGTTPGTDYDVINVTGQVRGAAAAPNDWGTLTVTHPAGDPPVATFTIMSYASRQGAGDFTTKNFPGAFDYTATPGATSYALTNLAVVNEWIALTGAWEIDANWSLGHKPLATENVLIRDRGAAGVSETITVSTAGEAARKLVSDENLSITGGQLTLGSTASTNAGLSVSGGTLTANGALTANTVTLSGGTINGTGDITINGPFSWSAGPVGGSGLLTTTGATNINGAAAKTLDTRTWNMAGTVTQSGDLSLAGNAVINNQATGAWTMNTAADADPLTGAGTFNNEGILNKNGVQSNNLSLSFFNNTGTVNVSAGRLVLNGASAPDAGNYDVDTTAILQFNAARTLDASTGVSGAGEVRFTSGTVSLAGTYGVGTTTIAGGRANFNSAATTTDGSLGSGTLGGSNTLTVNGTFDWTGGNMANGGTLEIAPGAFLNISSNATRTIANGHDIDNSGTVTWTDAGNIQASGASTITNRNIWNAQNTSTLGPTGTGTLVFNNLAGATVEKNIAGTSTIAGAFNNAGTVNVFDGVLRLTGGGTSPNTGTFNAVAGAATGTIEFGGGSHTVGGTITGGGHVTVSDGTLISNGGFDIGGAFTFTGGNANFFAAGETGSATVSGGAFGGTGVLTVNGPLAFSGGTIGGAGMDVNGTTTVTAGAAASLDGTLLTDVFNMTSGDLTVGIGGALRITGGAASTVSGASTLTNAGLISVAGAPGSSLTFNGTATLHNAGSLVADSGNIVYSATQNFNNGTSFGGTASNRVTTGSAFNGAISTTNLVLAGGTHTGTADFTGTTTWSNGVIGGDFSSAGTFIVNGAAAKSITGTLTADGFSLSGGGTTDINGGTLTLSGNPAKTISGTGTTLVNNGTLSISGDGALSITAGAVLDNNNTASWNGGAGGISLATGATLTNDGTFNLNATQTATGITGTGATFTNSGDLISTAAGLTTVIGSPFNNTAAGTVSVNAGTLALSGGGAHSGAFSAVAGTAVDFAGGTHTLTNAALGSAGSGRYIVSGGVLAVDTPTTVRRLDLAGGTLAGAGDVTVSVNFNASGGTITGTGELTTGGTTSISGAVTLSDKLWNNEGALTMSGGARLTLGGSGATATTFANTGTGTITITSTSTNSVLIDSATTPVNKSFVNQGIFNKNAGSAATQSIDVAMTNGGTVNVNAGTLALSSFPTNDGTLNLMNNATLSTGGNALTNAATGTIMGNGTIDLGVQALTNEGDLRPGTSAGTLSIAGDLVLAGTSNIHIQVADPGATPGTDYDVINVAGQVRGAATAQNDWGTLTVTHPTVSPPAGTFTIMSYGFRVGDFTTKSFPANYDYTATPGATSYALTNLAALNTWTGLAGDGLWQTPGNWSLLHVPTAAENALIPDVGTVGVSDTITVSLAGQLARKVTADENLSIASGQLTLGNAASTTNAGLSVSGGALTVNGTLTASSVNLASGALGGSGTVTVSGGAFNWTGGNLSGTGTLAIAGTAGSALNISSNASKLIVGGYDLSNAGTVTWTDAGLVRVDGAGTMITNSGQWNAQNSSSLTTGGVGTAVFNNTVTGTLTKSGAGTTSTFSGATAFNNDGMVNVLSGTLSLAGGGTSTGTFNVGGGTLEFDGGVHSLNAGSNVSGAGMVSFTGSGTTNVAGAYAVTGATNVAGGTVSFNAPATTMSGSLSSGALGGNSTLTVDGGAFNWTGGNLDGTGTLAIAGTAGSALNISGNASKLIVGGYDLSNAGTVTWTDAGLVRVDGAGTMITNSGQWNAQNSSSLTTNGPGTVVFTNTATGTLMKSGAGTTSTFTGQTAFNNDGMVNVLSGTLSLAGGGTSTGTFNVGGGTLEFDGGVHNLNAGSNVSGAGTVSFTGSGTTNVAGAYAVTGATNVAGGTVSFNAPATTMSGSLSSGVLGGNNTLTVSGGAFNWTGGNLSGTGTLAIAGTAGSALNISGNASRLILGGYDITNAGTVTWTNAGLVRVDGAGTVITNSGQWNAQNNSSLTTGGVGTAVLNNTATGTLTKSGAGTSAFSGATAFNNDGMVNVLSGTLNIAGSGTGTNDFIAGAGGTLNFGGSVYDLTGASDVSGAGTVSFTAGTTNVAGAYAVTGTTNVAGGTVNFNSAASTTNGSLSSGTLGGSNTLTVSGGAFDWTGGNLSGTGTLAIAGTAGSALNISSNASKLIVGGYDLSNAGTVTWTDAGLVRVDGAGTVITNSGQWNAQNNSSLTTNGPGTVAFNNTATGTLTRSGAGTSTFSGATTFNNDGTVNVLSGTLTIAGGGTGTNDFIAGAGGTLNFGGGTYNLNAGSNVSGAGTVSFTGGTTNVAGAYAVTGATNVAGGTVSFNAPATTMSGNLSSGVLGGNSTLTVSGGAFNWTGGNLSGTGTLAIAGTAGSALNISGNASKLIVGGYDLSNAGTVTWTDAGLVRVDGAGTVITNSGQWNAQNNSSLTTGGVGTAVFNNTVTGTLMKSGAGTTSTFSGATTFNNDGTVNVLSGTLSLAGGGTSTGTFNVGGGTLEFDGGVHNLNAGSNVSGAGTVSFTGSGTTNVAGAYAVTGATNVAGGTVSFNAPATTMSGNLSSGVLGGNSTLTVSGGAFNWTGGNLSGTGTLAIAGTAGSALNISGNASKLIVGGYDLSNAGTVTWTDAGLVRVDGAGTVITNSGQWNAQNNSSLTTGGVGTAVFNNTVTGTLTKSGAGTTSTFSGATAFDNDGMVNVLSGTLQANGFPTNNGTIEIAAGGVFSTGGNSLVNAGTIGGEGTLDLDTGTLTNNNILRPGAATGDTTGTLTITGNLTQGAAGQVNMELGGTAASDFDVLAVTGSAGNADLTGTLNLTTTGEYVPGAGHSFPVLTTTGTRAGLFTNVNRSFTETITLAYSPTGLSFDVTPGAPVTWINPANGNWSIGGNWSSGQVPIAGETVNIPELPGTVTITVPAGNFFAGSLTSDENLTIAGGNLLISNASTINGTLRLNNNNSVLRGSGPLAVSNLVFTGGSINKPGGVTVSGMTTITGGTPEVRGPLTVNGLNMTGGTLTVFGTGSLAIGGTAPKTIDGGTTAIVNNGALAISGDGAFSIANGATITNNSVAAWNGGAGGIVLDGGSITNAGTVNLNATIDATGITGAGTFQNNGTLNSTAAGMTTVIGSVFNNPGTVNVTGGTLSLAGGGTSTGTFDVAGGGTLQFGGGTHNLNAGAGITGNGGLRVSGGRLNVNVDTTLANPVELMGGNGVTLGGSGDLTLDGPFAWSQGANVAGSGTLTTTGTTTISNANSGIARNWTNTGTVNMGPGATFQFFSTNSTLTNEGTFNLALNSATPFSVLSGSGTIANQGVFNKNGAGVQTIADAAFTNAMGATLNVNGGTLAIPGMNANAGTIALANGATLTTNGMTGIANTGTIAGAGTISVGPGQTLMSSGTLDFTGPSAIEGTLALTSGTLQAGDTLNLDVLTMTGGALDIGTGGNLAITGASPSTVTGGMLTNAGGLTVSGGSTLTFSNTAAIENSGTLNAQSGSIFYRGATQSFNDGTVFTGAGTNNRVMTDSAFNGTIVSDNLRLESGAFSGTATFAGTTRWTGGTVSGNHTHDGTLNVNGTDAKTVSGRLMADGFNMTDGALTVTGTGRLTLAGAGAKTIDGATASIVNDGMLVARGAGTLSITNGATLTNNDTASWNGGAGGIVLGAGSMITNDGTFNLNATIDATGITGEGTFRNNATLNSTAVGMTTVIGSVFNNPGTVNVTGGTLSLQGNGTDAGTYAIGTGTTLETRGLRALNAGSAITGEGMLRVSGGRLNVNTGMTLANPVELTGGNGVTLGGSGDLTLDGPFTWSQGANIAGTGMLVTSGMTTISNANSGIARNWTNTGTVNMGPDAAFQFFNTNSTLTNQGTFNLALNRATPFSVLSGSGTIANQGVFNKNGAGVQTIADAAFTNAMGATLNVNGGTLAIPGMNANAGTIALANGATLTTNGMTGIANTGTIAGAGTIAVGPGQVVTSSGILDFSGATTIDGGLELNGGTLQGAGPVNVANGLVLSAGTIAGAGGVTVANGTTVNGGTSQVTGSLATDGLAVAGATLNVASGGMLRLTGTTVHSIDGGTLDNRGVVRLEGAGGLDLGNGATFLNRSLFDLRSDAPINAFGTGMSTLDNRGTLLKSGGAGISALGSGGSTPLAFRNSGTLNAAVGILLYESVNLFDTGTIFNGAGSNIVAGSSVFNGDITAGNLTLQSGNFDGNGTFIGNVAWSGGTMIGDFTVRTGSMLTLAGADVKRINGAVLTNDGTIGITGGNLRLNNGASLVNNAVIAFQGTSGVDHVTGAAGTIENAGLLGRAGAGTTTTIGSGVTLNNTPTGAILVQSGTLRVDGGLTASAGTIRIDGGAVLATNGTPLTSTGTLTGNGTLDLGGATFFNNGAVGPGASPGTLTIDGNYTQGPLGLLAIELGGTTQGVDYDLLKVNGAVNLNGTLQLTLVNGHAPAIGNEYDVMTYSSRNGNFSTFVLPSDQTYHAAVAPVVYTVSVPASVVALLSNAADPTVNEAIVLNEKFLLMTEDVEKPKDTRPVSALECRVLE